MPMHRPLPTLPGIRKSLKTVENSQGRRQTSGSNAPGLGARKGGKCPTLGPFLECEICASRISRHVFISMLTVHMNENILHMLLQMPCI